MGAFPTSDLPAHERLHRRIVAALQLRRETPSIEFKASESWTTLKFRLTSTVLGMSNLRDGGIIVIGASERDQRLQLEGITAPHLSTYDSDKMAQFFNAYASPPVTVEIVLAPVDSLNYLVIGVREFQETPHVCKKSGTDLMEGAVYTRLAGPPRTSRVMRADEMHELLEIAAENRARRILRVARRVGLVPETSDADRFERELEGL